MFTDAAIRQFWARGINAVSGNPKMDFKSWLRSGRYQILENSTPQHILIHCFEAKDCLRPMAFDINRLSIAYFETIQSIAAVKKFPRSLAWLAIKSYYSAFFAAHVLLRIQGRSCSYLEIDEIRILRKYYDANGIHGSDKIRTGSYNCTFDSETNILLLEREDNLAAHEFLWKVFYDRLKDMDIQLREADDLLSDYKNSVSIVFQKLRSNLTNRGSLSGNWLSRIRNEVNYRQEHEAWYPHGKRKDCSEWIERMSMNQKKEVDMIELNSSNEADKFLSTCLILGQICNGAIVDLSERCPTGKSFLTYGPLAFLKMAAQPG